ncbi:DUF1538 domain-containing protein [Eubacteriales bacterium OttesenSCG-928-A19]|nr:DUF1538 domain-containing protein [Eubacteriales bacterium OttesenSCG-928-A19]
MNLRMREQISESLHSVLPITGIVLLLAMTIAPIEMGTMSQFVVGALLLIVGMGLFTLGVEMSLTPMGSQMGSYLTKRKNLKMLVVVAFVMGFFITIAEPDLTVLAGQVPGIPNMTLILSVAVGVGVFLVFGFLRIIFQKKLNYMLIIFYALLFGIGIFVSENYVPVAFDSGGVTTGPITVPFILALGVGVASVRSGKSAQGDSFGLVAMGSIGPIMAVMILSVFYPGTPVAEIAPVSNPANTHELLLEFGHAFPEYFGEVALALAPILVVFIIFQLFFLKLPRKQLLRIGIGLVYTYVGLVLFLTGVNVGFMPVGSLIGTIVGGKSYAWILIPVGMVMGYYVVSAEPAVHVLNEQVEELTGGAISKKAMMMSLSIGVAVSVGLSMVRVLTGISIWWMLVPGYLVALVMTFFVDPVFTGIAFDSGGVASGAMATTFILPFTIGACAALGGNIMTDAFGVVAMVAMTPLITIQALGLIYRMKTRRMEAKVREVETIDASDDEEIIDV